MKNLITEYNINEEDENKINTNKKFLYRNIQTTQGNHYKAKSEVFDLYYLDYAFRQKKNLMYKAKNKVNLTNYCYELENTISLNLEIMLSFFNNTKYNTNKKIILMNDNKSRDTADTNSSATPYMIIKLIKNIKEKVEKKAKMNQNKIELVKRINDRIYENKKYTSKLNKEKKEYRQKIHQINKVLDTKDKYLILMNKKFYTFQNHIDNIPIKKEKNVKLKNKNIYDVIFTYINYKKKVIKVKNDMQKYYFEISDIKLDNELYKEELELRKDPNYLDLIRCMEFYRRTNLNLFYDIKILKKAFQRIVKILDFLNLGYIVKFSKKKQEEEANYEIEFSKINKDENTIDLLSKMNRNLDSSISFTNI